MHDDRHLISAFFKLFLIQACWWWKVCEQQRVATEENPNHCLPAVACTCIRSLPNHGVDAEQVGNAHRG